VCSRTTPPPNPDRKNKEQDQPLRQTKTAKWQPGVGPTGWSFLKASKVSELESASGVEHRRRKAFFTSPRRNARTMAASVPSPEPSTFTWRGRTERCWASRSILWRSASTGQSSIRCWTVATTERFAVESLAPPRAGVRSTRRGKAKKRHQAEAVPVVTADDKSPPQVFENSDRTPFGMRLMSGELNLQSPKKSPSHSAVPTAPTLLLTSELASLVPQNRP
jgi:hypothetical protein